MMRMKRRSKILQINTRAVDHVAALSLRIEAADNQDSIEYS
jgi:hypothetical protein